MFTLKFENRKFCSLSITVFFVSASDTTSPPVSLFLIVFSVLVSLLCVVLIIALVSLYIYLQSTLPNPNNSRSVSPSTVYSSFYESPESVYRPSHFVSRPLPLLPTTRPATIEEIHVVDVHTTEIRPAEVQPAEVQPAEVQPAEVQPAAVQPAAVQPAEVQPAEVQPAEKIRPVRRIRPTTKVATVHRIRSARPILTIFTRIRDPESSSSRRVYKRVKTGSGPSGAASQPSGAASQPSGAASPPLEAASQPSGAVSQPSGAVPPTMGSDAISEAMASLPHPPTSHPPSLPMLKLFNFRK